MTMASSSMHNKRKRSTKPKSSVLPTELLSSLESSDRKAAKLYHSQTSKDSLPKSLAAQSQLDIQTQLMECRIILQKALTASASLPTTSNDIGSSDDSEDKDEGENEGELKKAADRLLVQLLQAREMLCPKQISIDSDETPSESDSSDGGSDDNEKQKDKKTDSKLFYSNLVQCNGDDDIDLDQRLQQEYKELKHTWKQTLNKRHTSLHLNSGGASQTSKASSSKFQVVDQSFWSQVESTVRHDLLLSESQNHHKKNRHEEEDTNNTRQSKTLQQQHEIFDDSKVYRHMLQEFITLSTDRQQSGTNSAAEAAAERLKRATDKKNRSNQKNGAKADVDRKASKGRKIRYVVHEKLTNFMFPMERPPVVGGGGGSMIDENVLFKSMFGGVMQRGRKNAL